MAVKERVRRITRRRQRREQLARSVIFKPQLAEYLPSAPVVIEAGAHRGVDTVGMAKQWPDGRIHAFEPVPDLYRRLVKATGHLENVATYQLALSDAAGTAAMHVSPGNDQSSSLLPPTRLLPDTNFGEDIQVRTTTLDAWATEQGVDRVDFFWLDMEGSELAALRGGERLVSTATAVYTEVALAEQYEGEALYPELRGWLEDRGFRVEIEKLPWKAGGNVLLVRG